MSAFKYLIESHIIFYKLFNYNSAIFLFISVIIKLKQIKIEYNLFSIMRKKKFYFDSLISLLGITQNLFIIYL